MTPNCEKISISIPETLINKIDDLGKQLETSRSELISKLIDFGLRFYNGANNEIKLEDDIILRMKKGCARLSPWKEGDHIDIMPLNWTESFRYTSSWNPTDVQSFGQKKITASASLVCIGLETMPRIEHETELSTKK